MVNSGAYFQGLEGSTRMANFIPCKFSTWIALLIQCKWRMWIRGGCGSNIELWVSQVLSLLWSFTLFHQSLNTVWDLDIPMWICSGHVFSSMFKVTPIICPPREHPFLYPTSARSWGIFTRVCFYSYPILLHHSILTSQCLKANQILMVNKMVSIMIYVFIHTHTQIWHS